MLQEKNTAPVLEFDNVIKNYKNITALQGVSFTIHKGDIFGYIGPNGAGKTTTLKIMVGLISEYSGTVKINGESIQKNSNLNHLIGYLPQDVGFQEWRTVDHILKTFGLLSGLTKIELSQRIPEVLQIVGLLDSRKRKISHLSGGMKQKLKLAQALLHNPKILILDEPMSGLDPTSRWEMKNIIRQLAGTNVTIIFSSHILEDVEGIATTIGIIKQGVVVKFGSPEKLQTELVEGDSVEVISENIVDWISLINSLPNVSNVSSTAGNNNRIIVKLQFASPLHESLVQLMDFFVSKKIAIRAFNYLKPSLEQVYLKYIMEEKNA